AFLPSRKGVRDASSAIYQLVARRQSKSTAVRALFFIRWRVRPGERREIGALAPAGLARALADTRLWLGRRAPAADRDRRARHGRGDSRATRRGSAAHRSSAVPRPDRRAWRLQRRDSAPPPEMDQRAEAIRKGLRFPPSR